MVSGPTFKTLIHFELIFVNSVREGSFHFVARGCPVFPPSFIEKTICPPLYSLGVFVIN